MDNRKETAAAPISRIDMRDRGSDPAFRRGNAGEKNAPGSGGKETPSPGVHRGEETEAGQSGYGAGQSDCEGAGK